MTDREQKIIRVADFTLVPMSRYRSDGDGSAEEFFEDYVLPIMKTELPKGQKVTIDMDNTWGFPPSFISELARRIKLTFGEYDEKLLAIKSTSEPSVADRFWHEYRREYHD